MNETATYNKTNNSCNLIDCDELFFSLLYVPIFATQATIIYNEIYLWRYRWAIATIQ